MFLRLKRVKQIASRLLDPPDDLDNNIYFWILNDIIGFSRQNVFGKLDIPLLIFIFYKNFLNRNRASDLVCQLILVILNNLHHTAPDCS